MKNITIAFLFAIGICLTVTVCAACAQQGVPVGPGDNQTPIGGIVVVAALGGGYAVKKLREKKK